MSANVLVTLSGAASASMPTDASGHYAFAGLADGSYLVTPSLAGYTFSPASASITVAGADVIQDFSGLGANTISGTMSGLARISVTVTLSGAASATVTTDALGHYAFTNLPNGNFTVTPSLLGGYMFAPTSAAISLSGASVVQDFIVFGARSFTGVVTGLVQGGVTVTLTGDAGGTATTDGTGHYSFTGLADGTYTVTPSLAGGYLFTPTTATVTISGADVTQNFTDSGAYGISGTITGAASSGLTVTLSGSKDATTSTDALGNYSFMGLPNGSYTVTPSGASYDFTPASASVTIANSSAVQNFSSTVACSWQPTASYSLSSTPAGAVIKNGAMGGQGPSAVYGRTAWYQSSDWNLLFVPTGLAPSDDVFAVEADLYLPSSSALDRTADIEVFTTTATLPGPNGTCQASGGVAALLGGQAPLFSWNSTATCAWTQLDSVSIAPPTDQWRRFRIEGVRSTCTLRALLDGVFIRTWAGSCGLNGTYFVLSSNYANSSAGSLAAWSNLSVFKGNSPTCVP